MNHAFENLLLDFAKSDDPARRREIEAKIWQLCGTRKAIFAMDMSGFSTLTQRHGIVHYLSMVRRMQLITQPVIESHGGAVVKFEADNCFAAFDSTLDAVRAGIAINHAFAGMNVLTSDEMDIRASIGIDEGEVLRLDPATPHATTDAADYMGHAVNRAHKLGEDIAGPGEILITTEAFARVPAEAGIKGEPMRVAVSGIEIDLIRVRAAEVPESVQRM